MKIQNNLKREREARLLSMTELARKAGVSVLTISRIEQGFECRFCTKRKILEAMDIPLGQRTKVWPHLGNTR
jgi:transcriptional regulator with XRE-family HTH domain